MKATIPLILLMTLGCSAGESTSHSPGGAPPTEVTTGGSGGTGGTGGLAATPPPPQNLGGETGQTHPLFGAGSYTGVDLTDPCDTSQFWKVETAMELTTGTLVIYEGTLWELTGTSSEAWAMEACTPPGTGWCKDQYAWVEVGTCPEA